MQQIDREADGYFIAAAGYSVIAFAGEHIEPFL